MDGQIQRGHRGGVGQITGGVKKIINHSGKEERIKRWDRERGGGEGGMEVQGEKEQEAEWKGRVEIGGRQFKEWKKKKQRERRKRDRE